MDGAYVEIPIDGEVERVKAEALFDDVEYRGSIVRMDRCYLIEVPKALRKEIGKQPRDILDVRIDKEEWVVELPEDSYEGSVGQLSCKDREGNRTARRESKTTIVWHVSL